MAITVPRDPEAWARLGKTIREHREEAGYSRRALAEKAGVSEKSIQVAEEGRVPRGRMPQSLSRIEEALGWLPGSHISILRNTAWARMNPPVEVEVSLEPQIAALESKLAKEPSSPPAGRGTQAAFRWVQNPELAQSGHLAQDTFVRQMRRYRKLQGVSVEELAERASTLGTPLSEQDIAGLEGGVRHLRMTEAEVIARALGISVEWLLGSGFSSDASDAMTAPPTTEELLAESAAVERRLGEAAARADMAQAEYHRARERAEEARAHADMAMAMAHTATAEMATLQRQYHYLLGRIDSLRPSTERRSEMQDVSSDEKS